MEIFNSGITFKQNEAFSKFYKSNVRKNDYKDRKMSNDWSIQFFHHKKVNHFEMILQKLFGLFNVPYHQGFRPDFYPKWMKEKSNDGRWPG